MRLLQQAQLAHAGEGVEGFIDDKLLSITQALLQERLQDGGALPTHIGRHTWGEKRRIESQTGLAGVRCSRLGGTSESHDGSFKGLCSEKSIPCDFLFSQNNEGKSHGTTVNKGSSVERGTKWSRT